jgi:hypothetical protein
MWFFYANYRNVPYTLPLRRKFWPNRSTNRDDIFEVATILFSERWITWVKVKDIRTSGSFHVMLNGVWKKFSLQTWSKARGFPITPSFCFSC